MFTKWQIPDLTLAINKGTYFKFWKCLMNIQVYYIKLIYYEIDNAQK